MVKLLVWEYLILLKAIMNMNEQIILAQPLLLDKEIEEFNIITIIKIQLVCHGKHGKN